MSSVIYPHYELTWTHWHHMVTQFKTKKCTIEQHKYPSFGCPNWHTEKDRRFPLSIDPNTKQWIPQRVWQYNPDTFGSVMCSHGVNCSKRYCAFLHYTNDYEKVIKWEGRLRQQYIDNYTTEDTEDYISLKKRTHDQISNIDSETINPNKIMKNSNAQVEQESTEVENISSIPEVQMEFEQEELQNWEKIHSPQTKKLDSMQPSEYISILLKCDLNSTIRLLHPYFWNNIQRLEYYTIWKQLLDVNHSSIVKLKNTVNDQLEDSIGVRHYWYPLKDEKSTCWNTLVNYVSKIAQKDGCEFSTDKISGLINFIQYTHHLLNKGDIKDKKQNIENLSETIHKIFPNLTTTLHDIYQLEIRILDKSNCLYHSLAEFYNKL